MTKYAARPLFCRERVIRMTDMLRRSLAVVSIALLTAACATPSSHILLGAARPAISPDDVRIYPTAPEEPFEEIALLNASSGNSLGGGGQKSVDEVISLMKVEAARLGANGVILGDLGDRQSGSLGTSAGSDSYSRNSAVGVGLGGSAGLYQKTGKGTAIYVQKKGLCIVGCGD